MRYTEQEFKLDHIFDYIRYGFSSIILAPFRLINEITKKICYLPLPIIEKCCITAIGLDVLITVITIISLLRKHNFSLFVGKVPLIACLLSLVILGLLYYGLSCVKMPTFKYVSDEDKKLEDVETKEEVVNLAPDSLIDDDTLAKLHEVRLQDKLENAETPEEEIEAYNTATPAELLKVIEDEEIARNPKVINIGVPEGKSALDIAQEVATAVVDDEFDLNDFNSETIDFTKFDSELKGGSLNNVAIDFSDIDLDNIKK